MAISNYGILLKKGSTVIGNFVSVDLPEFASKDIESTNHSCSGTRTYIPGGLVDFGVIGGKMEMTSGTSSTVVADMLAKTVATYTISIPGMVDFTGQAFPTKCKIESADAQKPDELVASVEFRTSGLWSGYLVI